VIQADVTCSLFNVDAENLGVSSAWAERKSKCSLEAVSAEQEYRSQGFTGERDKYSIPIASDPESLATKIAMRVHLSMPHILSASVGSQANERENVHSEHKESNSSFCKACVFFRGACVNL
jgi:hypothetical protein